jgi:antitoxin component HigA of HigAB toxin-antitoxin module
MKGLQLHRDLAAYSRNFDRITWQPPIETEEEYNNALARVSQLLDLPWNVEGMRELDTLILRVEAYEDRYLSALGHYLPLSEPGGGEA